MTKNPDGIIILDCHCEPKGRGNLIIWDCVVVVTPRKDLLEERGIG
jgi:hypothetical protein